MTTSMTPPDALDVQALLGPWNGPYGGLPPFDRATPQAIESAFLIAWDRKRAEIDAISRDPSEPTFENTIEALENAGRDLTRVDCLRLARASTLSTGDMPYVNRRLAPLAAALEDEIAHDDRLFARVEAVHASAERIGLSDEQRRLTTVIRDRLARRGAGLDASAKARLAAINGRLAELSSTFNQNLIAEQASLVVYLEDEADLAGLSVGQIAAAATAAAARGKPGQWALPIDLPLVWSVLAASTRRRLRERVWRLWNGRGMTAGPWDNRPIAAEMLKLRGEKARLLGYPDYAHFVMAERMARTPAIAMELLERVWDRVHAATVAQIAELQALADAEGAGYALAAWDRRFYAERLRQSRFGLDAQAVRPFLSLDNVLGAMFAAAGRLHGVSFTRLPDAPTLSPDIQVFEVAREGSPIGVVWLDLFVRPGKSRGSWQSELRARETFRGEILPLSMVVSNLPAPDSGEPVLMGWEIANVLFHELGHALHMLMSRATYPSLGSMHVAWDFIELPSQLNERWLLDRDLLRTHMRHHQTGEPIPMTLIDGIEQGQRYDRIFTLTLDGLFTAISDLKIHLAADGGEVDALAIEEATLARLDMPPAVDLTIRVMTSFHTFVSNYAAGMYSYLWSDVLAADVAEAFTEAPGGLYDAEIARRWRRTILSAGASLPADEAFRRFRGRDPDPSALMRRFGLDAAAA